MEQRVLQTRLTRDYDLDVPIVSAGMASVGMPPLVAAVSEAGGLGILGAALMPPEALRATIRQIRSMTTRPFGVNLLIPFTQKAHVDVCVEERVSVVSFFWGDMPVAFISQIQATGAKVWIQVDSLREAREAAQLGVDAVIVQGSEAGGHNRSTATTLTLVPAVVDAIAPVPVIAAGGIADGRGVVAALALGAEAVSVGTRLLASQEAFAHDEYKRRVVAATVEETARSTIFGPEWPHAQARVLRNRVVSEWINRQNEVSYAPEPTEFIGKTKLGGLEIPMPKFSALLPTPETTGDFEEMCMVMGESAGLVKEIKPAGEIVREMAEEARQIMTLWAQRVRDLSQQTLQHG